MNDSPSPLDLSITQKSAGWLQGLGFSSKLRAFE